MNCGLTLAPPCPQFTAGPSTWLLALASCVAAGGTLAKIETQAEQAAAEALTGDVGGPWWCLGVTVVVPWCYSGDTLVVPGWYFDGKLVVP